MDGFHEILWLSCRWGSTRRQGGRGCYHTILRTFCPSPYLLRSYIVYVTTPQVQLLMSFHECWDQRLETVKVNIWGLVNVEWEVRKGFLNERQQGKWGRMNRLFETSCVVSDWYYLRVLRYWCLAGNENLPVDIWGKQMGKILLRHRFEVEVIFWSSNLLSNSSAERLALICILLDTHCWFWFRQEVKGFLWTSPMLSMIRRMVKQGQVNDALKEPAIPRRKYISIRLFIRLLEVVENI